VQDPVIGLVDLILTLAPMVLALIGIEGGLKGLFERVDALPTLRGGGALVTTGIMAGVVIAIAVALGWAAAPADWMGWTELWALLLGVASYMREQTGVAGLFRPKPKP
jgi:hypothetical protein